MGDKETQAPAVVVVAEIHSHVPKLQAFTTQRDTGQQAHIGKCAVVIVVEEVVGNGVVSDQKIGPAIVVVIGPHHAQAIIANVIMHAGFVRNLFKGSITTIVVKKIGFAFQTPGATLDEKA